MNKSRIFNIIITIVSLSAITSCNLDFQEDFDFDHNARLYEPMNPFTDMTMWEFMNDHDEFDSLVAIATLVGMEGLYSGGSEDRTILMLRNEAIGFFLADQGADAITDVPLDKWEKLLNYHVITTRFTQEDIFSQVDTRFQTLIDGDDGQIWVWKWRRYWQFRFNSASTPGLPADAHRADVYLHNYLFSNGVGHQMRGYAGWTAY